MALKKWVLLTTTMLFFMPLISLATSWQIIPEKSNITFTATQNGAPVSGNFSKFSGTIDFDPQHLNTSKADILVDMASVNTSYKEVAETLKTAEWFNIKDFPTAEFKATKFSKITENQYQAEGTLTIRKKSIPLFVLFTLENYSADSALAKGNVTLKRTQLDVGTGQWTSTNEIKDDVAVSFVIEAKPSSL